MEGIVSMIESSSEFNEVTSVKEINQSTMQEFLEKVAIWDFFEMTRDEFTSESDFDRDLLIIKYYNSLLSGILLLFVLFLFEFCLV